MANYRTALKQARGMGAAHAGTEHFIIQRITGVSNIIVIAFLVYAAVSLAGAPRDAVKAFFAMPINAIMGVLLAISVGVHMRLGMQVIIEDYIHKSGTRVVLLILNTFFSIFIAVATIMAVAKLYLGM
jgi:succinate dehydrogenase / fumarate reductase membrane anchor subunit